VKHILPPFQDVTKYISLLGSERDVCSPAAPNNQRSEGGDLREAKATSLILHSYSCVNRISGLINKHLKL